MNKRNLLILGAVVLILFIIIVVIMLPEEGTLDGSKKVGEPCTTRAECEGYPDVGCNYRTNKCDTAYREPGEICSSNTQCIDSDAFNCVRGTCQKITGKEIGEACERADECKGWPVNVGCINFKCTAGPNDGCPAGKVPCGGTTENEPVVCCLGT